MRRLAVSCALTAIVAVVIVGLVSAATEQPVSIAFVTEGAGCSGPITRLLCEDVRDAAKKHGISTRIVIPSPREPATQTLSTLARRDYDLVVVFGVAGLALESVAARFPDARFALLDFIPSWYLERPLPNVKTLVIRTHESAFLAGVLAARMEQARPGPDVVSAVGGLAIPAVQDFIVGFRAGAHHAGPKTKVLVGYSDSFTNPRLCKAIALRQIARGAGVVFNVAGACGLGTLEAARERGVWGVGVDDDQSFLGPHILTSVVKRYGAAFAAAADSVKKGRFVKGWDPDVGIADGASGLRGTSSRVPASIRAELARLQRQIRTGAITVPGAQ